MKKYLPAIVIVAIATLLAFLGWHDHVAAAPILNKAIAIVAVIVSAFLTATFWSFDKPGGQVVSPSKMTVYVVAALAAFALAAWLTLAY